ncbi:MAG: NUDIX hydrolase [Bradyrhizobium sp.]|nr:NUDIX hydrolase [Bradyrhizobium sp.]
MARAPVLAAGGIVLRPEATPLIAVVRLRKRDEWVLPKGKLDDGETPRDAAEREVLEETGHDVSVHEFLGTLVYESGGRFKVVHYWRMETSGEPSHELMDDVRAVDWLPLDAAVERLSRAYERAFLANVGPLALESAALARFQRRPKPRKPPVPLKRRRRPTVAPPPPLTIPATIVPPADAMPAAIEADLPLMIGNDLVEAQSVETQLVETPAVEAQPIEVQSTGAISSDGATADAIAPQPAEEISAVIVAEPEPENEAASRTGRDRPVNLVQIVRDWLWRAA